MAAVGIAVKNPTDAYVVRREMIGRVPERDFMDVSDADFARADRMHQMPVAMAASSLPTHEPLRETHDTHRPWHATEFALAATDGFDLYNAVRDSVTSPGAILTTSPTQFRDTTQPYSWQGTKELLRQAHEYLTGSLGTLKEETSIIGSFDTNQQKSTTLKAFVPLSPYSDSRKRKQALDAFAHTEEKFFRQMDALSMHDASQMFGERPDTYSFFRKIRAKYGAEWSRPNAADIETARQSEYPDIEIVTPEYCDRFRYPREASPLARRMQRRACRNGDRCVCNTMNTRCGFIALEFLTPRENRVFNESGTYARDVPHICVDCERAWYTDHLYAACRVADLGLTRPVNRFRVLCEDGSYNKRTMLPPMLGNSAITGIVGMVPTFSEKYLKYVPCDAIEPGATPTRILYRVVEKNVDF